MSININNYKKKLTEMKKEYEDILISLKETGLNDSLQETTGELSSYDNHPADLGSEVFERSKDLCLRNETVDKIKRIEDALKRIDKNEYGKCQICGKSITEERLDVKPEATMCIKCQEKTEKNEDITYRPVEEKVISMPFGGLQRSKVDPDKKNKSKDTVMFDGEDTWQAVNRYGSSNTPSDLTNDEDYVNLYDDLDYDLSGVEKIDSVPYRKGKDGMNYEE